MDCALVFGDLGFACGTVLAVVAWATDVDACSLVLVSCRVSVRATIESLADTIRAGRDFVGRRPDGAFMAISSLGFSEPYSALGSAGWPISDTCGAARWRDRLV